MTREEGKTLSESRGEVQKSINLLEYYAGASFSRRRPNIAERKCRTHLSTRSGNRSAS